MSGSNTNSGLSNHINEIHFHIFFITGDQSIVYTVIRRLELSVNNDKNPDCFFPPPWAVSLFLCLCLIFPTLNAIHFT